MQSATSNLPSAVTLPRNIPDDINVELLLSCLAEDNCRVSFQGLHKRNAYYDLAGISDERDFLLVNVGRCSLYDALPEYLFHPIDRFSNLTPDAKGGPFSEEVDRQTEEEENARRFFEPADIGLLLFRQRIRLRLKTYYEDNSVLQDILGDRLTDSQRGNRFISQSLTFLPCFKTIRGNKTLLTLLLRKIFLDEGMDIALHEQDAVFCDPSPQYADGLNGYLNDSFVGNVYDETVTTYDIHYWSDDDCDEHFLQFVRQVDEFRHFVEDYLLAIGEQLVFDISHDGPALRLADEAVYNYLDYNTNI